MQDKQYTLEHRLADIMRRDTEAAWFKALGGRASTQAQAKTNDILTADVVRKAADTLGAMKRRPAYGLEGPFLFTGLQVFEEPLPPPKLKLSAKVQVSDEFRRNFDAWLLAEFGRQDPVLEKDRFMVMERLGVMLAPPGGRQILSELTV